MYFAELIVLLFCCYNTAGFRRHGVKFDLQMINETRRLSSAIDQKWLQQPLDQFDASEQRTWNMKYFECLDFLEPNGPIYLYINGESPADQNFLLTGYTYELAMETKGAMFLSEHRYYGDSKPLEDLTPENLKFLSSRQALADNAKLIMYLKQTNPSLQSSKVVVIGGSYAGNLAAWMKLLYPDLVDAAIASSAPVFAKADFYESLGTVNDDFEKYGTSGCYDNMRNMFKRYVELLQTDDGLNTLVQEEQICSLTSMKNIKNQQLFLYYKIMAFESPSQYGGVPSIKMACDHINSNARVFSLIDDEETRWSEKLGCYDYDYENFIEEMRNNDNEMTWTYQTCTEFGYFATSNVNNPLFSCNIPKEFYLQICTELFGPTYNEERVDAGVRKTNEIYGGLKPKVTKVVFSNGEMDPWHNLSILEDLSDDAPAKVIPFSAHCGDLSSDRPDDPEELKETRRYVKNLIKKWISSDYEEIN